MKTGLFLGAGASYELGMPLVWQLTGVLKAFYTPARLRKLNEHWRRHGGGHADQVLEGTLRMLSRPDLHYENILGYLQTEQRRLGQDQKLAQDFHGMYLRLVESVCAHLSEQQIRSLPYCVRGFPLFEGLRGLCPLTAPLWIFSLNHDLVIELLAEHFNIPLRDGFWPTRELSISSHSGGVRADTLTESQLEGGELHFFSRNEHGINLLKIHGALDTFACRDGKDLCRLCPTKPGVRGIIDALHLVNAAQFHDAGGRFHVVNEIVYADEAGEAQFLRRSILAGAQKFNKRYDQTLPHRLLQLFEQHVRQVQNLHVIGYSFGDHHIDRILREWLETLPNRRMSIVDPFRTGIPPYLAHVSHQVELFQGTASAFFQRYRSAPLTRAQRLEYAFKKRLRPVTERMQLKRIRRRSLVP